MHFTALLSLYAKEHPDHLRQSLASLAAQTQPAAEILIVLDGAITPAIEAVLAEFADRLPLNIIRLPENVGLGRALNHGVQHARHEWIFRPHPLRRPMRLPRRPSANRAARRANRRICQHPRPKPRQPPSPPNAA